MKKNILILFILGFVGTLAAQEKYVGIVFMDNEPWEMVLSKAKLEDKLIFMDCYTTWCGPCKGLSENIFPLKEVGDFFNENFINAKYDMEKGDGLMLYEKFKEHIPGFPSLLLVNSNGEVVHKMAGYKEADALIAGMKAGMQGGSLFALEAKYNAGAHDLETVSAYAAALKAACMDNELKAVIGDYIDSMDDYSELENPQVWALVGENIKDPYSPIFAYVVEHIDGSLPYRAKMNRYKVESQLANAISNQIKDIVSITKSTDNRDTLRMAYEKEMILKSLLATNNVKRFPDYLAKLEMNDLILTDQPVELFDELAVLRKTGLLKHEESFLVDCYSFIIENVNDKALVRTSLDELIALQGPKHDGQSPLDNNFYDRIARGYAKLGEEVKAMEAWSLYEEMKAASDAFFEKIRREILGEKEE